LAGIPVPTRPDGREAIERFGNHDVEGRLARPLQHRLISRPKGGRAADRGVAIDLNESPAFAGDLLLAQPDLVVDRSRALLVGRVPDLDDGAHATSFSDSGSLQRLAQLRQHRGVAPRHLETPRIIVVLFGRPVSGVAGN
jgi:hypothetical protein